MILNETAKPPKEERLDSRLKGSDPKEISLVYSKAIKKQYPI